MSGEKDGRSSAIKIIARPGADYTAGMERPINSSISAPISAPKVDRIATFVSPVNRHHRSQMAESPQGTPVDYRAPIDGGTGGPTGSTSAAPRGWNKLSSPGAVHSAMEQQQVASGWSKRQGAYLALSYTDRSSSQRNTRRASRPHQ